MYSILLTAFDFTRKSLQYLLIVLENTDCRIWRLEEDTEQEWLQVKGLDKGPDCVPPFVLCFR